MVIKPSGLDYKFEVKSESQVNGVAVFVFIILMLISSGAAVWMGSGESKGNLDRGRIAGPQSCRPVRAAGV